MRAKLSLPKQNLRNKLDIQNYVIKYDCHYAKKGHVIGSQQ